MINSTLRDAGHRAHCHWIDRPDALNRTLREQQVEILILNCDRYDDSIRDVIKQKDLFNPEVPVIALGNDASEQAIQKALLHGACDLVSIGRKRRLQAVVSRELRALRIERALHSTLHSATAYRKQAREYMHESVNAIALVAEGIVTEANKSWIKLFNLESFEDIDGMPLMDIFDTESHAALKGAIVATLAGKWGEDEVLSARQAGR